MEKKMDDFSAVTLLQFMLPNWLQIRLEVLGACVGFFVAALSCSSNGFISPQYVGIALTSTFGLPPILNGAIGIVAAAEASMSSAERILYYTNNIIPEESEQDKQKALEYEKTVIGEGAEWPSEGKIEMKNVHMGYRDGPLVLADVSFQSHKAEKIGIAGRTGSGKSSLMVGLFRMEKLRSGSILIDGVDISKVSLERLRNSVGIIPQDPVLFADTVRFNLDPFNQHRYKYIIILSTLYDV